VLWATGFRPDHSCLDIPVRDRTGRIRHDGGVVTGAPGLYVLGMPVLRTRASTYIHGAGADSGALANHLHSFLGSQHRSQPAASRAGAGRGIDDLPRPARVTGSELPPHYQRSAASRL